MTAALQDLAVEQGADFRLEVPLPPDAVLPGAAAAMQLRAAHGFPAVLTLTTASGGLAIDATARRLVATVPAAATAALLPGGYVYDVKLREAAGAVRRLAQGRAFVSPEVTAYDFAARLFAALKLRGGGVIKLRGDGKLKLRG